MSEVKTICWHCHQKVRMDEATFSDIEGNYFPYFPFPPEEAYSVFKIYTCCNCEYPNIAECKIEPEQIKSEPDTIIRWIPFKLTSKTYEEFKSLPEDVRSAAIDAHTCFEVGVYSGAVLLTRRALEYLLKYEVSLLPEDEQISEKKPLYNFLMLLINKRVLSPYYEEAASTIRYFGNDVAHKTDFDFTKKDSENLLIFLDSIIDELFGERREWAKKILKSHEADHNKK